VLLSVGPLCSPVNLSTPASHAMGCCAMPTLCRVSNLADTCDSEWQAACDVKKKRESAQLCADEPRALLLAHALTSWTHPAFAYFGRRTQAATRTVRTTTKYRYDTACGHGAAWHCAVYYISCSAGLVGAVPFALSFRHMALLVHVCCAVWPLNMTDRHLGISGTACACTLSPHTEQPC
jgi:hypothetical protein